MGSRQTRPGTSLDVTPESESVAMRVIEAVARREGIDSVDLPVPLNEAIDCDALDRLFGRSATDRTGSVRVEFSYAGYNVVVAGGDDPEITVEQP